MLDDQGKDGGTDTHHDEISLFNMHHILPATGYKTNG
jgi:hypothetical protein